MNEYEVLQLMLGDVRERLAAYGGARRGGGGRRAPAWPTRCVRSGASCSESKPVSTPSGVVLSAELSVRAAAAGNLEDDIKLVQDAANLRPEARPRRWPMRRTSVFVPIVLAQLVSVLFPTHPAPHRRRA